MINIIQWADILYRRMELRMSFSEISKHWHTTEIPVAKIWAKMTKIIYRISGIDIVTSNNYAGAKHTLLQYYFDSVEQELTDMEYEIDYKRNVENGITNCIAVDSNLKLLYDSNAITLKMYRTLKENFLPDTTLEEICQLSDDELLSMKGLGVKSVAILRQLLKEAEGV